MKKLSEKIGESTYDGLITDLTPAPIVRGGEIRKLDAEATLKRGTILAKSSGSAGDDKLVILGTEAESNETLTPYGILCDDVEVGTTEDVSATVYLAGCFDDTKCTVKTGYTMTEADKDALRQGGIFFKAASPAI